MLSEPQETNKIPDCSEDGAESNNKKDAVSPAEREEFKDKIRNVLECAPGTFIENFFSIALSNTFLKKHLSSVIDMGGGTVFSSDPVQHLISKDPKLAVALIKNYYSADELADLIVDEVLEGEKDRLAMVEVLFELLVNELRGDISVTLEL